MATVIYRKQGETGNSLVGTLNNRAGTLVIPSDASVVLSATNKDTGARVIDGVGVTILDRAARLVEYDFRDGDLENAATLDLEFAIITADAKPTYVPDEPESRLLLVIGSRIAS
jgi:hypothetical protein